MTVSKDEFWARYETELARAVIERPEEYGPAENYNVLEVVQRMRAAYERGAERGANTYNKDSIAFQRTCRAFGIPHTYKGIRAALEGTGE